MKSLLDMEVTLKAIKGTQHFAMFRDILLTNLRDVIWYIDSLEYREDWRKPWLILSSTHYLLRAWHSYVLAYHILSTSHFIIVPVDILVRAPHFTRCSYWDIYRHSECHTSGDVYTTMTSYIPHGVSNHWQVHCLFNSLLELTTEETSNAASLALCEKGVFPSQVTNNAESVSMPWRHHEVLTTVLISQHTLLSHIKQTLRYFIRRLRNTMPNLHDGKKQMIRQVIFHFN